MMSSARVLEGAVEAHESSVHICHAHSWASESVPSVCGRKQALILHTIYLIFTSAKLCSWNG